MAQKKILVVEDERAIREMLAFNLGRAGYEVRPAGDGREARAAIADGQPDLVLMDWMLPDVSGSSSRANSSAIRTRARSR